MARKTWRSNSKNHAETADLILNKNFDVEAAKLFPLRIPKYLVEKINFNDENDPILLQVLPQDKEHVIARDYINDPVGDIDATQGKGVIHKYQGRVLLIANGACAVNCRYCFRRNFPYSINNAAASNWSIAITYIKNNPDITEVILSGGDPLMHSTKTLERLTNQIVNIKHITTLRIHTRIPLVLPNRITKNFLNWLKNISLKKVMVIHCNHPQELDDKLNNMFKKLAKTNTTLLNQSVLLKNINDNAEVLTALSQRLFKFGILPYYLNQLDKVTGTTHFQVSNNKAKSIHQKLLNSLPGYLVPKLVEEISGKKHKSQLN